MPYLGLELESVLKPSSEQLRGTRDGDVVKERVF